MSESTERDDPDFHNKLKSLNIRQIEALIANTISDLAGVKLNCTISSVVYDSFDGADLTLQLRRDILHEMRAVK